MLRVVDAMHPVGPDAIEARQTTQGFLRVEARLARDGLQEYSDGTDAWLEYRDRRELDAAAKACEALVVTDDHPPAMLTTDNATGFARGWAMADLRVDKVDGVNYLCATVIVFDGALIGKISAGKTEMSIGFRARIVDSRRPGAKYEQLDIELNHVSFVDDARGGPQVRALFDGRIQEAA